MISESFEDYSHSCVHEIQPMQDEFIRVYDLYNYQHYEFDEDIGIFRLSSDDGRKVYFSFSFTGSFSKNTNTWKWSWANDYMKSSERKRMEEVKAFGDANGFEPLAAELIDADEYTGWAMTAISARVLRAIGLYHFQQEHLDYYLVFHNEITQEQYDSLKKSHIVCETHGASRAAFVCQHLNKETATGFHEAFESDPTEEPEDDFQAWCDECEAERLKEGEWNDVSERNLKIRMVCSACYFEIKNRNIA